MNHQKPISDPVSPFSIRLLSFLDSAYGHADSHDPANDLFADAAQVFFLMGAGDLAPDVVSNKEFSDHLSGHIKRIQGLIDSAQLGQIAQVQFTTPPHLASLVIDPVTQSVQGNRIAADLFDTHFPCALTDLPLEPDSLRHLSKALIAIRGGQLQDSRILLLDHSKTGRQIVAKAMKLQDFKENKQTRTMMGVTMSYIGWTDHALMFFADQYALTAAETDLLQAFLRGESQAEAAETLEKSRETVKAQAKSILRKSRQNQMADLLDLVHAYAFLSGGVKTPDPDVDRTVARPNVGPSGLTQPDGRHVAVRRYGKPGGKPILFFHGLLQGPYFSARMSDAFAAAGFEVIAPSRPGFDRTDPPKTWKDFNATVTADVLAVAQTLDAGPLTFLVHQAGISFACRAAGALGGRVSHAVMVGAGVPIGDHMMRHMNLETRVAAAATRYAPAMFDLLLRLGVAKWRRQGPRAYLENFFGRDSVEISSLDHPEYGPLMNQGVLHMISQGPKTIIADGESAMSDWNAAYAGMPERQLWIHGDKDPVLNHIYVTEFLSAHGRDAPLLLPGAGGDILYAGFAQILDELQRFVAD